MRFFLSFFLIWIGKRKRIMLPYATKGFKTQAPSAEISSSWGAECPGVKLICGHRQIGPRKPQILQYLVACLMCRKFQILMIHSGIKFYSAPPLLTPGWAGNRKEICNCHGSLHKRYNAADY